MEDLGDNSTMSGNVNYTNVVEECNEARKDLSGKDGRAINVSEVQTALIITWKNMKPKQAFLVNPGHQLSFQLVILSTATRSYMLVIYERLDFHALPAQVISSCEARALAGMSYFSASQFYRFELSAFFYLTADKLLLHSNIIDYRRLGRYCLILDFVPVQPIPPRLNCAVPAEEQDPYCRLGVNPNYCVGRPVGIYGHPSFCDRFIYCVSETQLSVHQCQRGTGYNPYFRTCDWYGHYRCQYINRGQVGAAIQRMQSDYINGSLVSVKVDSADAYDKLVFAVHNNSCVTKGDGNVFDPISCTHFLQCTNTRTVRSECPEGLFFDPYTDRCDYKYNVECKDGVRPTIEPTRSTETMETTPKTNSTTGVPTPRPEPTPREQNKTTPRLSFTTESIRDACHSDGDDKSQYKTIPHPNNCYQFISCYNGKVNKVLYCPPGLYYNPDIKVCDFKRNVNCDRGIRPLTDEVIPTTSRPTVTISTLSFNVYTVCLHLPRGTGLIPDPENSSRYYECVDGNIFHHRQCVRGIFDRLSSQCYEP